MSPKRVPLTGSLLATSLSIIALAAICGSPQSWAQDKQGKVAQEPPVAGQAPPTVTERLSGAVQAMTGDPASKADTDMRRVLDALAKLGGKPIETLSAQEARRQPTPADAVKSVLASEGQSTAPVAGVAVTDMQYKGAAIDLPARIYKPDGAAGPLPTVLYFHGGGFVIADIDTYDAAPRNLAKLANVLVISAHYREAPENTFPAAHEDAVAAYKWVLENIAKYGGDPKRVAVMGESAGGNLAINVAVAARDQKLQAPLHQVLIYPVAGVDMTTPSYVQNETAKPLNKAMMGWFVEKYLPSEADKTSSIIDLVGKAAVDRLPPATVITAEIDPLRSEGKALADKLVSAGVATEYRDYAGSTHEFFGMAAAVKDAADAQAFVAQRLKDAFAPASTGGMPAGTGNIK